MLTRGASNDRLPPLLHPQSQKFFLRSVSARPRLSANVHSSCCSLIHVLFFCQISVRKAEGFVGLASLLAALPRRSVVAVLVHGGVTLCMPIHLDL